ncbi:MAG: transcriptional regulator NrdR [Puniceicoccales bacterium]|jgi:transcriptional repressor NrdR|nr:transcriptional regulator NrdR [Puniceicoccales bacterium]
MRKFWQIYEILTLLRDLGYIFCLQMKCPKCGHLYSKVTDTRITADMASIRRRRICLRCGHRFFTNEIVCIEYPIVIKRDGREEEFDGEKIKIGLLKAFKKQAGIKEKVNNIVNGVLAEVISKYPDRIQAKQIGTIVMNLLKINEPVAYLRFASIHKNFETAKDFALEFEQLLLDLPK